MEDEVDAGDENKDTVGIIWRSEEDCIVEVSASISIFRGVVVIFAVPLAMKELEVREIGGLVLFSGSGPTLHLHWFEHFVPLQPPLHNVHLTTLHEQFLGGNFRLPFRFLFLGFRPLFCGLYIIGNI